MAAPHEKVQKPFKVVQKFATTTSSKETTTTTEQQQQLSQAAVIQFALQL